MRWMTLVFLVCYFAHAGFARVMDIPSEHQDRVITVAFERLWGITTMDRATPEFSLIAYDQIRLARSAINADPETPDWMKADNVGVLSINAAKTAIELRFPDSLNNQQIRGFHLQFIRHHARTMLEAEFKIVNSLEEAIRALKADIETEKDPVRRQLLQSILAKTRAELGQYQVL